MASTNAADNNSSQGEPPTAGGKPDENTFVVNEQGLNKDGTGQTKRASSVLPQPDTFNDDDKEEETTSPNGMDAEEGTVSNEVEAVSDTERSATNAADDGALNLNQEPSFHESTAHGNNTDRLDDEGEQHGSNVAALPESHATGGINDGATTPSPGKRKADESDGSSTVDAISTKSTSSSKKQRIEGDHAAEAIAVASSNQPPPPRMVGIRASDDVPQGPGINVLEEPPPVEVEDTSEPAPSPIEQAPVPAAPAPPVGAARAPEPAIPQPPAGVARRPQAAPVAAAPAAAAQRNVHQQAQRRLLPNDVEALLDAGSNFRPQAQPGGSNRGRHNTQADQRMQNRRSFGQNLGAEKRSREREDN